MVAPACNVNFQKILENVLQWDEEALDGFKSLLKTAGEKSTSNILETYADNPQLLNQGFAILNKTPFKKWSGETAERMFDFMNKNSPEYMETFLARVSSNIDTAHFDTQIYRMLGRLDKEELLKQMLAPDTSDDIAKGVVQLLRKAEHPKTWISGRYACNVERAK